MFTAWTAVLQGVGAATPNFVLAILLAGDLSLGLTRLQPEPGLYMPTTLRLLTDGTFWNPENPTANLNMGEIAGADLWGMKKSDDAVVRLGWQAQQVVWTCVKTADKAAHGTPTMLTIKWNQEAPNQRNPGCKWVRKRFEFEACISCLAAKMVERGEIHHVQLSISFNMNVTQQWMCVIKWIYSFVYGVVAFVSVCVIHLISFRDSILVCMGMRVTRQISAAFCAVCIEILEVSEVYRNPRSHVLAGKGNWPSLHLNWPQNRQWLIAAVTKVFYMLDE